MPTFVGARLRSLVRAILGDAPLTDGMRRGANYYTHEAISIA